ncbi:hypothetical protein [Rhodoferax sp.]|uniref:hypothetical protein n=1 Tax=Rhodoferax sp. TaxID=50421 RepID=UPI002ACDC2C5|nr:hypothetical protein [Rhodoferax sp.]MDZ7919971.1 hypothetical protein [Rhodoferax sp.]
MTAKISARQWGWGGLCLSSPELGRGASGAVGAGDDPLAGVMDMGAVDAVRSLRGNFAEGNMPSVADFAFPGPVAEAYFWDDSFVVGIQGPVGSGKTTTKMKRKLRRAIMMPQSYIDEERHYKVLFVRENYRQLWSSVIPSYLETYPRNLGDWVGGRGAPVQHTIRFEDVENGGFINWTAEFMAFGDNVANSMRGTQVTDLDISEADTNPVDTLTFGAGRIMRYPGRQHFQTYHPRFLSYGQIDCDFNAPDEDNWTFKVFHDAAGRAELQETLTRTRNMGLADQHMTPEEIATMPPVSVNFYRQPGYGEPGVENLQNLLPGFYEQQIAINKLSGKSDVTSRMVYNRTTYLRAGDPVFVREFNARIHVAAETIALEPGVPLRLGFDQGFKGAAVIAQFVPPFHWRFLAELHFPNERLMAVTFGQRLADLLASTRFANARIEAAWGDMAGEAGASAGADENATWNRLVGQTIGVRVRPQRIGTNRLQPRLEAVRAGLEFMHAGQPGLIIDPACKFLRRGFEARYVWTDEIDSSGDKRKVPDKRLTEANVMDALQYLMLSEGLPSGLSKFSFPGLPRNDGRADQNDGRPMRGGQMPAGGLITGYDVMNPYGD